MIKQHANFAETEGNGPTHIAGLTDLWAQTKGNPDICVAVLDGPVDVDHPCFSGAKLSQVQTLVTGVADKGPASSHGTHVASIIFGQHDGLVNGLAPGCRGLILPIYADSASGSVAPILQLDLARAITQAVEQGAHIINISGGQLSSSGTPDPMLAKAVRYCEQKNVLIVAAAGNDGCDCLHVPASVTSVLAVGAIDEHGTPLKSSNWGQAYQTQGIVAQGENILGALPGGEAGLKTGTSFATPIVSGIAALLLSLQVNRGDKPNPHAIRVALLAGASPSAYTPGSTDMYRRLLKGTLNVPATQQLITSGELTMPNENIALNNDDSEQQAEAHQGLAPSQAADVSVITVPENISVDTASVDSASVIANNSDALIAPSTESVTADCTSCSGGGKGPELVYALGSLGFDFGTEARRDSFIQAMPEGKNNPHVPEHLLAFLKKEGNSFEASSLTWTLNVDATPVYAIVPLGPYASVGYDKLVEIFEEMVDCKVEMASIPGMVGGSVQLLSGQTVPAIVPAMRGMYSWDLAEMLVSVLGERPKEEGVTRNEYDESSSGLNDFLSRIYYDMRNLGLTSEERALNHSATNAFQASQVIESTTKENLDLDRIDVRKSPVCRPGSDCWDVELHFFNPQNTNVANKVYRFTVDVSDVIPVSIGEIRSFTKR